MTTEFVDGEVQMMATLDAVKKLNIQSIVLWPNVDAGSEGLSTIRKFREKGFANKMHFYKNLPIEIYVNLMRFACLAGNSSSGIRRVPL